ncbi:hypothetical protein COU20_00100 [Candidatus Kaiserbacteria bacterium CG10_big_fil_rev_8_21_14_0_10_59_10]|uniref:V-type ATPase subunit n=1 Tax=Candidatus Kaiserbacteria bacterium CG10_big_fil_rev_8_21_14_0_10_59_10 TaxID=1974612 RepID=A0A2H0U914_9BACT|nr:MAG: hypothetical protein COU20_00100 [Candidatus Kaiserbacteria bacterium CG10_big_fil_rev_8_21_14_0_10_59_10]
MDHYGAVPNLALDNKDPHFDARYVYAGTAAYSMLGKLLSETERERLIGAKSTAELEGALRETFFGTYLGSAGDMNEATSRAMADAKKNLDRLPPNPHLLSVLWLRYDFYNLKILIRHSHPEYDGASEDSFIPLGLHSYAVLERAVKSGNGAALHHALGAALADAPKDEAALDTFMEIRYLEAALQEAEESDKPFMVRYTRLLINLFAILSALRARARGESPIHIAVSDLSPRDLQSPEGLLTRLSHIGFSRHWSNAIERYRTTNDFAELDRAADDYLMQWLKRQSIMLDSPAPLFAYWHVLRENVQLVRAALSARKVHMAEAALREIIRTSYNSYVY